MSKKKTKATYSDDDSAVEQAARAAIEHRTESRIRETRESFCVEPGCEYAGHPSVQGHCFHVLDDETDRYITRIGGIVEEGLAFYRAQHQGDEYVHILESLYVSTEMNWHFTLDEVIKLRCENAAFKRQAPEAPSAMTPPEPTAAPGDERASEVDRLARVAIDVRDGLEEITGTRISDADAVAIVLHEPPASDARPLAIVKSSVMAEEYAYSLLAGDEIILNDVDLEECRRVYAILIALLPPEPPRAVPENTAPNIARPPEETK